MVEIVASGTSLIEVKDLSSEEVAASGEVWKFGGGLQKTDNVYYSDTNEVWKDSKNEEGQPWSSYFRVRIYTNIVNGKWKPIEEQEVSLNVREFGCKLTLLISLQFLLREDFFNTFKHSLIWADST